MADMPVALDAVHGLGVRQVGMDHLRHLAIVATESLQVMALLARDRASVLEPLLDLPRETRPLLLPLGPCRDRTAHLRDQVAQADPRLERHPFEISIGPECPRW